MEGDPSTGSHQLGHGPAVYPVKAGRAGAVTESLWSDQSDLPSEYNQEQ